MKFVPLGIEGAWLAESPVWNDSRGIFREWFKSVEIYDATGIEFSIQQANVSQNHEGVIRGIHYSLAPEGQSKWVTCLQGSILDVIVDIRPASPTFKKYEIVDLKAHEGDALLIGAGLGHGFISLEDRTVVSYLLNSSHNPDFEFGINPFDETLKLPWTEMANTSNFLLSEKDTNAFSLIEMEKKHLLP
jgi:dTDP-4-dehydrorhamnose 3,5-epimerase